MEKHQVNEHKQTNTDHQSDQHSNEGSNGKQPAPTENDSNSEDQETELPGIGDDNKQHADDIKMSSMDQDDNEDSDEEEPEDEMNRKTKNQKNGDSDAAPVTNRKENETVNK